MCLGTDCGASWFKYWICDVQCQCYVNVLWGKRSWFNWLNSSGGSAWFADWIPDVIEFVQRRCLCDCCNGMRSSAVRGFVYELSIYPLGLCV